MGLPDSDAAKAIVGIFKEAGSSGDDPDGENDLSGFVDGCSISSMGKAALPALMANLDFDADDSWGRFVLRSIAGIGADALPALEEALKSSDSRRRINAALAVTSIEGHEDKTTAMLVPGTDKAYLLVAMAPAPESGALQPLFDAAFASFRVTARPLAHQQAVNEYSRLAAIAGAALLLLLFAYKIIRGILS